MRFYLFLAFIFSAQIISLAQHASLPKSVLGENWTELTSLRSENTRTWLDQNGFYHTQKTGGYFHFQGPEGEWLPIQTTLTEPSAGANECGIYESARPIRINLQSGKTDMRLNEDGQELSFGESVWMEEWSANEIAVRTEMKSSEFSHSAWSDSSVHLHTFFPSVDRIQHINYWEVQTNYIFNQRPVLSDSIRWLTLSDEWTFPQNWTLNSFDQMPAGSLVLKNELGQKMAEVSVPKYWDASGKCILGSYRLELSPTGCKVSLLIPATWLMDPTTSYPVTIDPTISNTYANTQGVQDWINQFNANCQASMGLTLPAGPNFTVTNTSTQYSVLALGTIVVSGLTTYYAAGFEQRSRVGVGAAWTPVQNGFGDSQSPQTVPYNIANSAIANGCYPGGTTLTYNWQGYNTYFPDFGGPPLAAVSGCALVYHQLVANTWIVTVTYVDTQVTATATPVSQVICSGETTSINLTSIPAGASYTWTIAENGMAGGGSGSGTQIAQTLFTNSAQSGVATYTVTPTLNNCPGTPVNVAITVNPIYTDAEEFVTICQNQTYLFDGATYNSSGTYTATLQSAFGCDSIVTLYLDVVNTITASVAEEICAGNSIDFGANVLTQSGIYEAAFVTNAGCDSLVTLSLQVNATYTSTLTESFCQGGSFLFEGTSYSASGSYPVMLQTSAGCDSLITLDLLVTPAFSETISAGICQGSTYFFEGANYAASGTYSVTLQTEAGCDSIRVLNLSVNPAFTSTINASICEGETYVFEGTSYTQSGNYSETYQTLGGCDSIVTLSLTVGLSYEVLLMEEICEGESFSIDGFSYNQTGSFVRDLQTVFGCDSIVTLELFVNETPLVDIGEDHSMCQGSAVMLSHSGDPGTLIWSTGALANAITVSESGSYALFVASTNGCIGSDTVMVSVNALPQSFLDTDFVICSGEILRLDAGNEGSDFLWSNGEQTQQIETSIPGFYTVLITSPFGCQRESFAHVLEFCEGQVFVPNSFTPDDDGINDYFRAYGEHIGDFEMTIFSRWGEPLFFSDSLEKGWTGSFDGGEFYIQDQIAHWMVRYKVFVDPLGKKSEWREMRGHVLIIR